MKLILKNALKFSNLLYLKYTDWYVFRIQISEFQILESFKNSENWKPVTHNIFTGGCIKWDSKLWDSLSPIGATQDILEIRKKWDSIFWDK